MRQAQLAGIDDISLVTNFSEYFFFVAGFVQQLSGQFTEPVGGLVFKDFQFYHLVLFKHFITRFSVGGASFINVTI
ncbi:MAG: hypothetical protein DRP56_01605 [Planctomycetota bacterium]|nr:MAG: hypothetical protein DRP56_01605 [Planctomycetota bacterium]